MLKITLIPKGIHTWDVVFEGNILVTGAVHPEFAAARALVALGHSGPMETYSEDGTVRMRFKDVGRAAKLTMREYADGKRLPHTVPYKEFKCQPSTVVIKENP